MNNTHSVIKSAVNIKDQARNLAQLTRELSRCCQTKEEQIFGKFGLSAAEGRVLVKVAETGASTPSAVAEALGLGRSRLTPLVDHLVQKGLLTRTESPADRRMRSLDLTPAGEEAAQEVIAYQVSFHEELLKRFSPAEREELLGTLDNLHEAIEALRVRLEAESPQS